jgi:hypothetical protein
LENCGLRLDFGQVKGSFANLSGILVFGYIFEWRNAMDLAHVSWTVSHAGSRWTKNRGGGNGSSKLLLAAGMSHGGSPQGGENDERVSRVRF